MSYAPRWRPWFRRALVRAWRWFSDEQNDVPGHFTYTDSTGATITLAEAAKRGVAIRSVGEPGALRDVYEHVSLAEAL